MTRRRRKNVSNKLTSSSSESTAGSENRLNRLSLAGTSVYAGHLSSLVLGKLKSLWTVNSNSADGGLNQFTGRTFHYFLSFFFFVFNIRDYFALFCACSITFFHFSPSPFCMIFFVIVLLLLSNMLHVSCSFKIFVCTSIYNV